MRDHFGIRIPARLPRRWRVRPMHSDFASRTVRKTFLSGFRRRRGSTEMLFNPLNCIIRPLKRWAACDAVDSQERSQICDDIE